MGLSDEIKDVNNQLKDVRRAIRKLKVEEDSLCNRLTRLLELSIHQTKIEFDERECGTTDQGDGLGSPEAPLA
jgi:hypothetical protein